MVLVIFVITIVWEKSSIKSHNKTKLQRYCDLCKKTDQWQSQHQTCLQRVCLNGCFIYTSAPSVNNSECLIISLRDIWFFKISLKERNLIFNGEISNIIEKTNFEAKVANFPPWCCKTTPQCPMGTLLSTSFYLFTEGGPDETLGENCHLTPEKAVLLVVPSLITGGHKADLWHSLTSYRLPVL